MVLLKKTWTLEEHRSYRTLLKDREKKKDLDLASIDNNIIDDFPMSGTIDISMLEKDYNHFCCDKDRWSNYTTLLTGLILGNGQCYQGPIEFF